MTAAKEPVEEIIQRPVLELKSFSISDPHTERIYNSTMETIERFNIYVEDFFESREIIMENLEALNPLHDRERLKEYTESLEQVILRIKEIRISMEEMALHMDSLINLRLI